MSRFKEAPPPFEPPMSPSNITFRKKLAAVSTSLLADDVPIAASPRNCYARNNVVLPLRRRLQNHHHLGGGGSSSQDDEPDGCTMSSHGQTPVEQRAAEIRRMNSQQQQQQQQQKHSKRGGGGCDEPVMMMMPAAIMPFVWHCVSRPQAVQQSIEAPCSASTTVTTSSSSGHGTAPPPPQQQQKKPRHSSSSLVSALRSRASSPIDGMRKFFGAGRSGSKQPKGEIVEQQQQAPPTLEQLEIEKLRAELARTRLELDDALLLLVKKQPPQKTCGQQCDAIRKTDVGTQIGTTTTSSSVSREDVTTMCDKENTAPSAGEGEQQRIRRLETELGELRKECAEKTDDFRRTRKDFILILKEAVVRKNEAERRLAEQQKTLEQRQHHHNNNTETLMMSEDDEDWGNLMSPHRPTLRRNALLMWVQKRLEPYGVHVSNFSSDWTDCRAFCALLADLFPDAMTMTTTTSSDDDEDVTSPIRRCRHAFQHLGIRFDERALGIAPTSPAAEVSRAADHDDEGDDDDDDDDASSASSSIAGLTDWRYIMSTVFTIYKRGVLGK